MYPYQKWNVLCSIAQFFGSIHNRGNRDLPHNILTETLPITNYFFYIVDNLCRLFKIYKFYTIDLVNWCCNGLRFKVYNVTRICKLTEFHHITSKKRRDTILKCSDRWIQHISKNGYKIWRKISHTVGMKIYGNKVDSPVIWMGRTNMCLRNEEGHPRWHGLTTYSKFQPSRSQIQETTDMSNKTTHVTAVYWLVYWNNNSKPSRHLEYADSYLISLKNNAKFITLIWRVIMKYSNCKLNFVSFVLRNLCRLFVIKG